MKELVFYLLNFSNIYFLSKLYKFIEFFERFHRVVQKYKNPFVTNLYRVAQEEESKNEYVFLWYVQASVTTRLFEPLCNQSALVRIRDRIQRLKLPGVCDKKLLSQICGSLGVCLVKY